GAVWIGHSGSIGALSGTAAVTASTEHCAALRRRRPACRGDLATDTGRIRPRALAVGTVSGAVAARQRATVARIGSRAVGRTAGAGAGRPRAIERAHPRWGGGGAGSRGSP